MRILFSLLITVYCLTTQAQLGDPFMDANGKWGYKLKEGKIFVAATYDLALPWNSAGLAAVNIGRKDTVVKGVRKTIPGKWGLLHYTSGLVIPAEFDAIIPFNDDLFLFNGGCTVDANGFMTGGVWGIMDRKKRQLVLDPNYDFIGAMDVQNGVYAVYKGGKYLYNGFVSMPDKNSKGKWALVNGKGMPFTSYAFHAINSVNYAGFLVQDAATRLFGIYSRTGQKTTDCIYDTIYQFHWKDSIAAARKKGKWGFIRYDGREIIPFTYEQIADTDFDKTFIIATRGGTTYVVDKQGREMLDPPVSIDQQFSNALRAANNSKERGAALIAYDDALKAAGYSAGHCSYLVGQKMQQVVDIDFHGVFEYFMKQKVPANGFVGALSILKAEHRSAIKAIAQYIIDEYLAREKGLAPPAWPAGVPKAGYGWGKTVSSDRVVPVTTAPAKPAKTKKELEEEFLGKRYLVDVAITDGPLYGPRSKAMLAFPKRVDSENNILVYFQYNLPGSNQNWAFYTADELRQLRTPKCNYVPCSYCGGSGVQTSKYRHTNDYSYTLGQKHIYTTTTTSDCNKCCGGKVVVKPCVECEW